MSSWREHVFLDNNDPAQQIVSSAVVAKYEQYDAKWEEERYKEIFHEWADYGYREGEGTARVEKYGFLRSTFNGNHGGSGDDA